MWLLGEASPTDAPWSVKGFKRVFVAINTLAIHFVGLMLCSLPRAGIKPTFMMRSKISVCNANPEYAMQSKGHFALLCSEAYSKANKCCELHCSAIYLFRNCIIMSRGSPQL